MDLNSEFVLPQHKWVASHERDRVMQSYLQNNSEQNVYMDYEYKELSSIDISLKKQIEWVVG